MSARERRSSHRVADGYRGRGGGCARAKEPFRSHDLRGEGGGRRNHAEKECDVAGCALNRRVLSPTVIYRAVASVDTRRGVGGKERNTRVAKATTERAIHPDSMNRDPYCEVKSKVGIATAILSLSRRVASISSRFVQKIPSVSDI